MPTDKNDKASKNIAPKTSKLLSDPRTTKVVRTEVASDPTPAPSRRTNGSKKKKG